MRRFFFSNLTLAAIVSATIGTMAPAETSSFVEDIGAADRIRAADRLRTLTQEISAATCFLHNDLLAEDNSALLTESIEEFGMLLDALLHGNADMQIIGQEERAKTVQEIEAIKAGWLPVHDAAKVVLTVPSDVDAANTIYSKSSYLLQTTSHLLSELEGEYAHPTQVLMSDVMLLEFAGRQAMLTQKIAYDSCLVWSGAGGEEHIAELTEVTVQFDHIARALHDGMPEAGIKPAPTDEIRVALEEVVQDWEGVLTYLRPLTDGDAIGPEDVSQISISMTEKMYRMEAIVALYANYSRRAIR